MDKNILEHFKKNDPILHGYAVMIKSLDHYKKGSSKDYFLRLCREIVSQQLSTTAGDTIFMRFKKLFEKSGLTPKVIIQTPHEKLLSVGMSNSKARYVKNLAEAVINGSLDLKGIDKMADEEVKAALIRIKGIGPWTAEMFLMFTLLRPDVFSHGDLGLRKAIRNIYGFKKDPSLRTVERIVAKWSPYKTYASLVLWRSLEVI
jgi:DNA-3-methyladenine glycosylase II